MISLRGELFLAIDFSIGLVVDMVVDDTSGWTSAELAVVSESTSGCIGIWGGASPDMLCMIGVELSSEDQF